MKRCEYFFSKFFRDTTFLSVVYGNSCKSEKFDLSSMFRSETVLWKEYSFFIVAVLKMN